MEKCAQSVLQLSSLFSHLEFGQYVMTPYIWQFLFAVWCRRNAWFDSGYMFCVSRMAFGSIHDFLRDWVDSAPEVDSPVLTGDAPVARLLSLEIA